jgi:hypothetical protein
MSSQSRSLARTDFRIGRSFLQTGHVGETKKTRVLRSFVPPIETAPPLRLSSAKAGETAPIFGPESLLARDCDQGDDQAEHNDPKADHGEDQSGHGDCTFRA